MLLLGSGMHLEASADVLKARARFQLVLLRTISVLTQST